VLVGAGAVLGAGVGASEVVGEEPAVAEEDDADVAARDGFGSGSAHAANASPSSATSVPVALPRRIPLPLSMTGIVLPARCTG
jgi:hypothetical protein